MHSNARQAILFASCEGIACVHACPLQTEDDLRRGIAKGQLLALLILASLSTGLGGIGWWGATW